MLDNSYKNSLKEIYVILQNTDEELLTKIPNSFMNFIKENMNIDYKTNINPDIALSEQHLSKETEGILSLIYISYWATEEEKNEFKIKKKKEEIEEEKLKQEKFSTEALYKMMEERKTNTTSDTIISDNLPVVVKENIFKKLLNKIKKIFFRK